MKPFEGFLRLFPVLIALGFLAACNKSETGVPVVTAPLSYDLILRGGTIYDGSGESAYAGDVAFNGDVIAAIGDIGNASSPMEIDVQGLAVAPGFVNMMCWSNESLIEDGRSQSDIRQGVTLEVMGEGESMGPLNDAMKEEMVRLQGDIQYDIEWTTLALA